MGEFRKMRPPLSGAYLLNQNDGPTRCGDALVDYGSSQQYRPRWMV